MKLINEKQLHFFPLSFYKIEVKESSKEKIIEKKIKNEQLQTKKAHLNIFYKPISKL
jgi:hypothetical protein